MNQLKDYYKILEIKQSATLDEIKKAYRTLSKRYHPDMNKNGIEQFKSINEANSVLSDPAKRKVYDAQYSVHFKPKNSHQSTPSKSTQTTSNSSTSNKVTTQEKSSNSSTITVNGVKINVSGNNTTTNIRVVNGKVIIETS
jgi:curved DNA-binding protein CbpA